MPEPLSRACRLPAAVSLLDEDERAVEVTLTRVTAHESGFVLTYEGPLLRAGTKPSAVEFRIPGYPKSIDLLAEVREDSLRVVHFPLFEELQVLRWLRSGPSPERVAS